MRHLTAQSNPKHDARTSFARQSTLPTPRAPPPAPAPPHPNTELGLPLPQRYWAIVVVALGITLAVLDSAIANVALPTIARDLHASAAASIWVVNAYQLAITISLLPLASLGDRIGYRRVYLGGLILFTVASLGCALSTSLPTLALARVIQGFGAAGIMSVNTALVRMIYPPAQLGRGVAINAMVVAVSSAVGPTVASGVLAVAPWPWLFAINVPIGIAAIVSGFKALPVNPGPQGALRLSERGDERVRVRPADLRRRWPRTRRSTAAMSRSKRLGAVVIGYFFVRRQLTQPAPLLPDRSAAHSGVRAVDRHLGLLVRRADAGVRFVAVPAAGHARLVAGPDRPADDAVAARHHRRRAALRACCRIACRRAGSAASDSLR